MNFVLTWLVPIVVGMVIGYVTNDIAIKMLFRPLSEKRFLGLRVPFTPGILPKNRHKLALSLGNTVARELLNEDVLRKRFRSDDFRETVERQVESILSAFLDVKLGVLRFSPGTRTYERLESFLSGLLGTMTASAGFERGMRSLLNGILDGLGAIKLERVLGGRDSLSVARSLVDYFLSDGSKRSARERIASAMDEWAAGDRTIGEVLPGDLGTAARRIAMALYPEAFRTLLEFLRTPDMKRELAENSRVIVTDLLKRLNAVQRFLVAAVQYDKAIMADMDKTVADLLTALERVGSKEETRELLARQVGEVVDEWVALDPGSLKARLPDYRERILDGVDRVALAASGEKGRERIAQALAGVIDSNRGKTLRELARESVGLRQDKVAGIIQDAMRAFLGGASGSESLAAGIADFLSSFLSNNAERSVAELLNLSPALRSDILSGLSGKALELIEAKTSEILKTVRIRDIVVEKIDSLDMLSLERIVLDVMKEQFAWINVFGAILGGVIGLVQAIIAALV